MQDIKARFLRSTEAASLYFSGSVDALAEGILLKGLMSFLRLPPTQVRLGELGNQWPKRPASSKERESLPAERLVGWYPISSGSAASIATRGEALIQGVWYRRQDACTDSACSAKSFFDCPWDAETDCRAWLDQPFKAKLEDLWFSRRHLERLAGTHTAVGRSWPWGEYETAHLRHLAAAADRFWKLYDPSDISTAPTNEAVESWLKDRGVTGRVAQAMATILRADGLPTGPRK